MCCFDVGDEVGSHLSDVRSKTHSSHLVEHVQTASVTRHVVLLRIERVQVSGHGGAHLRVHRFDVFLHSQRRSVTRVCLCSGLKHSLGLWKLLTILKHTDVCLDIHQQLRCGECATMDALRFQIDAEDASHVSIERGSEIVLKSFASSDRTIISLASHNKTWVRQHETIDILKTRCDLITSLSKIFRVLCFEDGRFDVFIHEVII
mmetsp:Transcript_11887/g.14358  ORF Transcript_11887/g.14358 Transcript_11887/m.14358 type:complete len:205 (-) Transcript_11887:875-1489(-)